MADTYPVNQAKLTFEISTNGLISAEGYNIEIRGAQWRDIFKNKRAMVNGQMTLCAAAENLYYEPNTGAIILKPDISMVDMAAASAWYTLAGTGAIWTRVTPPGYPSKEMLEQTVVADGSGNAINWEIQTTTPKFTENHGFVFWWKDWVTAKNVKNELTFLLEAVNLSATKDHVQIKLNPDTGRVDIEVQMNEPDNSPGGGTLTSTDKGSFVIPVNQPTGRHSIDLQCLVVLLIDNYVVVGINGMENAVTFQSGVHGWGTPLTGNDADCYKILLMSQGTLKVTGTGVIVCGFKRMTYAPSGAFWLPLYNKGYDYLRTKAAQALFKVRDSSKTMYAGDIFWGSSTPIGSATCPANEVGMMTMVAGAGNITTPLLYSIQVRKPHTRATGAGTPPDPLTGDIREYKESAAIGKDGMWLSGQIETVIRCNSTFYHEILKTKCSQIKYELMLAGKSAWVTRGIHSIDRKRVSKPRHGTFDLILTSRDISKEIQRCPLLQSESFDDRGMKHAELLSYINTQAGFETILGDYSTDPILPPSPNVERPTWQWGRGNNSWEPLGKVQGYSGWMLFVGMDGKVHYIPRPTTSATAKYTISAQTSVIEDVYVDTMDYLFTRFLTVGVVARDMTDPFTGSYRKAGDIIMGKYVDASLEAEIGRSRPVVVIDPALSDFTQHKRMLKTLKDLYCRDHWCLAFKLNNFAAYDDLYVGDVISYSDTDVVDDTPAAIYDGKYMVTSINASVKKVGATAEVEAYGLF